MTNEGTTLYCGDNCNHTGPHHYPPTASPMTDQTPRTEAGRDVVRLSSPEDKAMALVAVLAIEAQARTEALDVEVLALLADWQKQEVLGIRNHEYDEERWLSLDDLVAAVRAILAGETE